MKIKVHRAKVMNTTMYYVSFLLLEARPAGLQKILCVRKSVVGQAYLDLSSKVIDFSNSVHIWRS